MCAVSGIQDIIEHPPEDCLGVILAGGRSSRMGKDKATVRIGQRTMLDITRSLLDAAPLIGHIVAGGDYADWTEEFRGHGPARAICEMVINWSQFSNAPGYLLFIPVDMPLIKPATLQQLIALAKTHQQAVYFDNHFLPLVIPVSRGIATKLNALIERQPSPSVRRLLNTVDACPATFTGAAAELSNINTTAELATVSAPELLYCG